jgi:L-alanine-DL-glutamate epimerase-like enolase superfamily enzyme
MFDIGQYVYWSTGGASSFALSAVEIALQDLRGKILGLPTYQLLGGKVRDKVKALASIIFDLGNPSNNIDQAKSCLKENFKAVKFDWGLIPTESFGQNFERDMEAVEEIRQTLGPSIDLILDVGKDAHWDAIEAIRWARELEKFRITWLEEPLPINDDAGHRQLKQNSRIPIAGGEWSYTLDEMQRLLTSQQLDIIQPDVGRFGGIQACKDAADLAARKNKHYSPHTWSTSVNMAASLQLLAVCSNGLVCEVLTKHSPYYDNLAINSIKQHDGYITIPTKPGIGVEVDENFVKSHDFSAS